MKRIFFSVGSLIIPYLLAAQFLISGTVRNSKGEKVENASVYLKNTSYGTNTDHNGYFELLNLPKGNYVIVISHISYGKQEKNILLPDNMTFDIILMETSYIEEEIIVTAIRADEKTPITQTRLNKEAIETLNVGQDIPYLLQQTPSLVTTSDAGTGIGYTGLRIRGTDGTRINVTINGVPLNDAESHAVFWVDLPDFSSSIEDIQIQRGVGTSTNGTAAFGGSINLQTKNVQKIAFAKADISGGSFNTFKQTYSMGTGLLNNHFQADARFSKIQSDGYIDRATADLKSYYLSGSYLSKRSMLKLLAFHGKEKTYQAWDGVPSNMLSSNRTYNGQGKYVDNNGEIQYYGNQTDNYKQTHLQLLYLTKFSTWLNANIVLHYTKGKGYYESYRDDKKYADYGISHPNGITITDAIDQKWLNNDFWGFIFSLQQQNDKLKTIIGGGWNRYLGRHFGEVLWTEHGAIEAQYEWYYSSGNKDDFNVFAKANYQLTQQWHFFADIQYRRITYEIEGIDDNLRNLDQTHDFNFFNPKIGVNFLINSHQHIYVSFAQAHREPNRNNFVDANPNKPTPKDEKLNNFEWGYNLKNINYNVGVNVYYMNYKDQLVLTGEINDVGETVMTNVDNSYRLGVEFIGGIKINQQFQWDGNISFSSNKIKDFTVFVDDWNSGIQRTEYYNKSDLSFSPEIIANSRFSYSSKKGLNISFISQYVGNQFIDNTANDNRKLDAYFVNNLHLNYDLKLRFLKQCTLKLLINNIFDSKYESNAWVYRYYSDDNEKKSDGYFPQAGIYFLTGVIIKF